MEKRRLKVKNLVVLIFMTICIIGLIYSIFNIIKWKLENDKTSEIQEKIQESIIVDEPIKNEEPILENYTIDFEELKNINSEVVGYVKVENTNIDSTVVKHDDNSYYLNHSFDKKWNSAGWVFSHYKNKYDGTDKNYVVFGHARRDGSMFGSLKNILTKEWQEGGNKVIFITENSKSTYEVFSVYKVKAEEYYITTEFKNDIQFENYIGKAKARSFKDFDVDVSTSDRLLTLSTCYSNNKYRIVLHAREVK